MRFTDFSNYEILRKDKGSVLAKYKCNSKDLVFLYEANDLKVEFTQNDDIDREGKPIVEDAVIRIMPQYDGCTIQFRANQPLGKFGKHSNGKKRNLLASGHLSMADLEYIVAYLKKLKK